VADQRRTALAQADTALPRNRIVSYPTKGVDSSRPMVDPLREESW